jgi:hypothetical protein
MPLPKLPLALLAVAVALAGCAAPVGDAEAAHAGTTCPEDATVTGFAPDGAPTCTASPLAGFVCPAGEVVVGFSTTGAPECEGIMTIAETAMQAEMARNPPPQPSAPAKSLAITSNGPIADGVKAYTIASASPGMTWGDLLVNLNGQMLERAEGCAPAEGEYAVCAGDEPEGADATVDAGDTLRVAAEAGQMLRIIDSASNSVVLTLNVG